MEIKYTVTYHSHVISKDIPKLSSTWRKKIKTIIEKRLMTHPDLYGKPLRRSLKNYYKLRIDDYRVIFRIQRKTVKIMVIAHRSTVYDVSAKRI